MRTGIAQGGANVESYSPVEQAVVVAGMGRSEVRFWRYNVWGDGASGQATAAPPDPQMLPRTEVELQHFLSHDASDVPSAPLLTDFFYVLAIRSDGSLVWLLTERINNPTWREVTSLDLTPYAGQTLRLQFGTYNNGTGGISRTVLDDAALLICHPSP